MEVHEVLKKHFPVSSLPFESFFHYFRINNIILAVDQTMPHFQVYKHNFGAHDQQGNSAANSMFPELFPSSPATMKSSKINLPFPVLISTGKTVSTN